MLFILLACAPAEVPTPVASSAPFDVTSGGLECPDGARFAAFGEDVEVCVDADGELHGPWRRWSGDRVEALSHYEHGLQDGSFTSFHEDGTVASGGQFVAGAQVGTWRSWRQDGSLESEEQWGQGVLQLRVEYDARGQLRTELHFEDGERHGLATWWFADGTRQSQGEYLRGHRQGSWATWYESGQLRSLGDYDRGLRTGRWMAWDALGERLDPKIWQLGEPVG